MLLAGLQQIGGVLSRSVKWFVERRPSTGEIIATPAFATKSPWRYKNVAKEIHQAPLSFWRGSGFETT